MDGIMLVGEAGTNRRITRNTIVLGNARTCNRRSVNRIPPAATLMFSRAAAC